MAYYVFIAFLRSLVAKISPPSSARACASSQMTRRGVGGTDRAQLRHLVLVPLTFLGASTYAQVLWLLPTMAFFVVGMADSLGEE